MRNRCSLGPAVRPAQAERMRRTAVRHSARADRRAVRSRAAACMDPVGPARALRVPATVASSTAAQRTETREHALEPRDRAAVVRRTGRVASRAVTRAQPEEAARA